MVFFIVLFVMETKWDQICGPILGPNFMMFSMTSSAYCIAVLYRNKLQKRLDITPKYLASTRKI